MFKAFNATRAVPLILTVGLATVLAGCGSLAAPTSGSGSAAAGGASVDVGLGTIATKNMNNIAVMIQAGPTFSDSAKKAEGAKAAAKELGVNVDIYWSALDPGTERSNYNNILSSGKYGGIAVQPVSPQLCKAVAADVVKAQVLVSVFGGPLCATGTETGDALKAPGTINFVDQNNLTEGAATMYEGAAKLLGDGPQKALLVFGNEGHTTVVAHEKAWANFAAAHPNWTLAGKIYTDWTTPGAYSATQNLLQTQTGATVILSTYVDITAGVVKAVGEQNKSKQISVFETSGDSDLSLRLLKEGSISGSVIGRGYDIGYSAVKSLVEAGKGISQPPVIYLPKDKAAMVTAENMGSFKP